MLRSTNNLGNDTQVHRTVELPTPKSFESFKDFCKNITLSYPTRAIDHYILHGEKALCAAYMIHEPENRVDNWHEMLPMIEKEVIRSTNRYPGHELNNLENRLKKQAVSIMQYKNRIPLCFEALESAMQDYIMELNTFQASINSIQMEYESYEGLIKLLTGVKAVIAAFWLQYPKYCSVYELMRERLPNFDIEHAKYFTRHRDHKEICDPKYRENPGGWTLYSKGSEISVACLNELAWKFQATQESLNAIVVEYCAQQPSHNSITVTLQGIKAIIAAYLIRYYDWDLEKILEIKLPCFKKHKGGNKLILEPKYYLNSSRQHYVTENQLKISQILYNPISFKELNQVTQTFLHNVNLLTRHSSHASFFQSTDSVSKQTPFPDNTARGRKRPFSEVVKHSTTESRATSVGSDTTCAPFAEGIQVQYPTPQEDNHTLSQAPAVIAAYLIHYPETSNKEILQKLSHHFTKKQVVSLTGAAAHDLNNVQSRKSKKDFLKISCEEKQRTSFQSFEASVTQYFATAEAVCTFISSITIEYNLQSQPIVNTLSKKQAIIGAYLIHFPDKETVTTEYLEFLTGCYEQGRTAERYLLRDKKNELRDTGDNRRKKQNGLKIFCDGEPISFQTLDQLLQPLLDINKTIDAFIKPIEVRYPLKTSDGNKKEQTCSGIDALIVAYLIHYSDYIDYDILIHEKLPLVALDKVFKVLKTQNDLHSQEDRRSKCGELIIHQRVRKDLSFAQLERAVANQKDLDDPIKKQMKIGFIL